MQKEEFISALKYIHASGDYKNCIIEQGELHRTNVFDPNNQHTYSSRIHNIGHNYMVIGFIVPEYAKNGDTYLIKQAGSYYEIHKEDDYSKFTFDYINTYNNFVYCPLQLLPYNESYIQHIWKDPLKFVYLQVETKIYRDFCNNHSYLIKGGEEYIEGYNIPKSVNKDVLKNYYNMSLPV